MNASNAFAIGSGPKGGFGTGAATMPVEGGADAEVGAGLGVKVGCNVGVVEGESEQSSITFQRLQ